MSDMIRYCVLKEYKGIFKKRHIGNTHLIMFSSKTELVILALLGSIEKNIEAAQLIAKADITDENAYMDAFRNNENFAIVEEIKAKIVEEQDSYKVLIPKKGTFFLSNLIIKHDKLYSGGNTQVFLINGQLALAFNEELTPVQLKMKAVKQKAKVATPLSRALAGI